MSSKESRIEFVAAVATWGVVTAIAAYVMYLEPTRFTATLEPAIALFAINLVAMLCAMSSRFTMQQQKLAHAVQLISTLALGWLLTLEFLQIFTIIWVAMAVSFYGFRWCLAFVAGLAALWYGLLDAFGMTSNPIITVSLFATFHLFAVLTSFGAARAERARERAEMLYAELVATQHLLTEASRQSERTRIARNLHDVLGHHLTALSINLQIAERVTQGEAKEKITASRSLAKLLLSDVRDSVTTLREQSQLDLNKALHLLVDNVPQLDIELDIDPSLAVDDVRIADALLRCVQEAITNTLKHANAQRQWIRLWHDQSSVLLTVYDDGRVTGDPAEGNGFAGMRERLQSVNGSLSIERMANALQLSARIPLPGQ